MLAPPLTPIRDRAALLAAVQRAGLLSAKQFDRGVAGLSADADAEAAAEHFVQLGLLTRFQAKRVLGGKTDGFFLGPYLILEPIGEGKGGKVYKARHKTMNRVVAVKLLMPERTRSAEMRTAFQQATRQAVQLLHPNVVTAFDANEVSGRIYIVLEYVNGADLDGLVRRNGPYPIEKACEFARQAAVALAHAHDRGMVHGRLNPANLLLGRPGGTTTRAADESSEPLTVKVLNFGFGRLAELYANDPTKQLNSALSATDYYAPEQLDARATPTAAADLYSLGCVLHYLLTGRPPAGDGPIHQFSNAVPIQHWRRDIPAALAKLVHALLERNPAYRPASAAVVAGKLEAFARDIGSVDFVLKEEVAASESHSLLTGLPADDPDSPFADLGDADDSLHDTVTAAEGRTPVATDTRRRKPPDKKRGGAVWAALLLAAGVILVTGWAIGLVIKSAMR
jgi:serine/threonine-protein kinase